MVRVFCPAVEESKPVTMSAVTGTVRVVPSESRASMARPVTSRLSPTAYSVLCVVLLTEMEATVTGGGVVPSVTVRVTVSSIALPVEEYLAGTTTRIENVPASQEVT